MNKRRRYKAKRRRRAKRLYRRMVVLLGDEGILFIEGNISKVTSVKYDGKECLK